MNVGLDLDINSKIKEIVDVLCFAEDKEIGLLRGEAGNILSLLYYSFLYEDNKISLICYDRIERLLNKLNNSSISYTYSRGLAGIGCFFCHIKEKHLIPIEDHGFFEETDTILYKYLECNIRFDNYDFLHGYLGIAQYFLMRRKVKPIKLILKLLGESAIFEEDKSVKWKSNSTGNLGYNLGLSHGMASIIVILSKVVAQNIDIHIANPLLKGSIKFLLNNKFSSQKKISIFPNVCFDDDRETKNSRLAWCYGDLGIARALWISGKVLLSSELQSEAIQLFEKNMQRKEYDMTSIIDAGLCHGSAGVAHLYNRMYLETGINDFNISAKYWMDDLINKANFTDGLAGYKSFYGKYGWKRELGFLEGISGILLTLMSYHKHSLDWDELLLIS